MDGRPSSRICPHTRPPQACAVGHLREPSIGEASFKGHPWAAVLLGSPTFFQQALNPLPGRSARRLPTQKEPRAASAVSMTT